MSNNQIQIGQVQAYRNVSGTRILKYTIEIYHKGLNEHKLISAPEIDILNNKADLQTHKWTEKWEIIQSKRQINAENEANLEEANLKTEEAKKTLEQIDSLLIHALSIDVRVDWEILKKKEKYKEVSPAKPIKKANTVYPPKPNKQSEEYTPVYNIFEKLFQSKKEKKIQKFESKYIASRKELKESYISESQINKMFDEAMYKITLRTIHELFRTDIANAIEAISFNGWVKAINRANGKVENNCILSIQVKKAEFIGIDLSHVDPKACFKNLKGVASSKLSSLTPIQPILQISRVDKRFVEGYAVANQIDNATNLAAMDWEDFEHLIRELFEKEFQTGGGEVKVTQASRDGGVDAIAFDPDPIRGGKIVIQAKRYTNTVGVSAVRDLYGTVHNEGATKGILVTTADYGPDAYEFAKGKPLTLLNGSNLLHLLEKHGHHAKIDLREAKKILAEKDK